MSIKKKTDWNKYYSNNSIFVPFTRKITTKILLEYFSIYLPKNTEINICELGGGNSCFYDSLSKIFPLINYSIIDSNKLSIDLFLKRTKSKKTEGFFYDLLNDNLPKKKYDLVYSVGLIEHFDENGTKKIINAHLSLLKRRGILLITFPTPTFLYKLSRLLITIVGLWKFHDERPLNFIEVERTLSDKVEIISKKINWKIFLTQGIIVAIKK